jgi:hypothetical protein
LKPSPNLDVSLTKWENCLFKLLVFHFLNAGGDYILNKEFEMSSQQHQQQESNVIQGQTNVNASQLEFESFKLEYGHLAEGYRHNYQTIWQAGSVFMAISAALLVLGSSTVNHPSGIDQLIKWIWPLPFFFWWLGIFTPMDRYGKLKLQRLQELEKLTQNNSERWPHRMENFTYENRLIKRQKLICFPTLRVGHMVDIFALIILLVWIGLIVFETVL